MPMRRSSFTECWVGFVFSSPGIRDEGDERDVDVEHVLGPDLAPELADRLEERLRLDVADRAADLGDDDVGVGDLRDGADARLDLVRDVRDHLHGRAEVLALALAAEHAVPDRAGGVVRGAGEVLVDEPLVVADVEIGLGAVLGDEHLAVLERAHRSRVDVQVRVELLHLHLEAARLQQTAERRGGDSLAEGRDDATGDEHVLRRRHDRRLPAKLPTELHLSSRPLPSTPTDGRTRGGRQRAAAIWTSS